jgi:hypothetical protein
MAELGRPPIYPDAGVLSKKCDEWIAKFHDGEKFLESCLSNPPTINGLSRSLGFESKSVLYEGYRDHEDSAFSVPVKKCIALVEEWHERGLSAGQCTGHIFGLKNSGWKDHTTQEVSGGLQIIRGELPPLKNIGDPVSF